MLAIALPLTSGRPESDRFATAVMLGAGYSATVGVMGSLTGTPADALFAAHVGHAQGVAVGFMLPVATSPNAIVMDSPAVTRPAMLGAGTSLDVIGLGIAVALRLPLAPLLL